jgi:hypothetical protein
MQLAGVAMTNSLPPNPTATFSSDCIDKSYHIDQNPEFLAIVLNKEETNTSLSRGHAGIKLKLGLMK